MQHASDRTFAVSVAASILVHVLILFVATGLLFPLQKRFSAPPIVAHLVPDRQTPLSPQVAEARPEPKVRELPPAANPPLVLTKTQPVPSSPPMIAVPVPRAPAAPEAPPTAEVSAPAVPADLVAVPAVRSTKTDVPAAAADAFDPLTLGQYRIAIIAAAKRYKKYPRLAMDNNWEGQAEVRIVVSADGTIASIRIKTPSGFDVLDQQALEMIRKAKDLAPIPAALRGKGFTVDVPVLFSLKDELG